MEADPIDDLNEDLLADLARLADGTLPADRRAEVEARLAASPQLASIVERQRVALDAVRGTADTGAPARLRAHVDRRRNARRVARGRRGRVGGAIAAAAAVGLALILVLPGLVSGGPSVDAAAALAERPPTGAAPGAAAGTPQLLRAEVDDVSFPNYAAKFGWRPVGARQDHPSGRDATTVYYENDGRTVAYTIVSGDALDPPSGAASTTLDGVEYRKFRVDSRPAVTWERDGHTCVLSGKAVPPAELLTLANWRGKGTISF